MQTKTKINANTCKIYKELNIVKTDNKNETEKTKLN